MNNNLQGVGKGDSVEGGERKREKELGFNQHPPLHPVKFNLSVIYLTNTTNNTLHCLVY